MVGAIILVARVASAQTPPEAQSVFDEGRALLDAHHPAEACAKFDAALKLDPEAAGTILNLGLCNEQLDRLATALRWFRRVEVRAAETTQTEAEVAAKAKAAALATKVPTLRFVVRGGGTVTVDGARVDEVDYARVELDAGPHVIELTAPREDTVRQEITLADGDARTVQLAFRHFVVVDRGAADRHRAYLVAAGGAGVLVLDGVLALLAKQEYDASEDPATQQSWKNAARYGGTSLFVIGVAAVAGGAFLYLHAPGKERVEQTVVAPIIDRDRVGFAFARAF